jgi:hypothetical protein
MVILLFCRRILLRNTRSDMIIHDTKLLCAADKLWRRWICGKLGVTGNLVYMQDLLVFRHHHYRHDSVSSVFLLICISIIFFRVNINIIIKFIVQDPAEIHDDFAKQWNRWRGEYVLERSSSETQSISVTIERWSVEHRAFAVETYLKNNDSVLTQRIFRRHFNVHRNECP